ncbi:hypothetical protein BCR44DRAFT_1453755, partial [Catenaria anguillulae PL171]
MAWVGPIPHSVNQDAALEHLKRKYKSTAIAGEQLVNGSRFYKAIFGNQQDVASAIDQSLAFSAASSCMLLAMCKTGPASSPTRTCS